MTYAEEITLEMKKNISRPNHMLARKLKARRDLQCQK